MSRMRQHFFFNSLCVFMKHVYMPQMNIETHNGIMFHSKSFDMVLFVNFIRAKGVYITCEFV